MEKSVVLRDGSVLQISRPRGENAAEILEYLKIVGGETHFLLMDENLKPHMWSRAAECILVR